MSSGEAELYAINTGCSEGIAIKHLLTEAKFAKKVLLRISTDSSAGKSLAVRFGASRKSRHIELRHLYVQHLVKQGILTIRKIPGVSNPADVFTKYVSKETLSKHLRDIGIMQQREFLTIGSIMTIDDFDHSTSDHSFTTTRHDDEVNTIIPLKLNDFVDTYHIAYDRSLAMADSDMSLQFLNVWYRLRNLYVLNSFCFLNTFSFQNMLHFLNMIRFLNLSDVPNSVYISETHDLSTDPKHGLSDVLACEYVPLMAFQRGFDCIASELHSLSDPRSCFLTSSACLKVPSFFLSLAMAQYIRGAVMPIITSDLAALNNPDSENSRDRLILLAKTLIEEHESLKKNWENMMTLNITTMVLIISETKKARVMAISEYDLAKGKTFFDKFRAWSEEFLGIDAKPSDLPELPLNFRSICEMRNKNSDLCLNEFNLIVKMMPDFSICILESDPERMDLDLNEPSKSKVFDFDDLDEVIPEIKAPTGLRWRPLNLATDVQTFESMIGHLTSLSESVSIYEKFIWPSLLTSIEQWPKEDDRLDNLMFVLFLTKDEFSDFKEDLTFRFRDLEVRKDSEDSEKYYLTVMTSTPFAALGHLNLVHQKGFKKTNEYVLIGLRMMKNRVTNCLTNGLLIHYSKGSVRGVAATDDFYLNRTEANNLLIISIKDFDLTKFHDDTYRSDEAFRAQQLRSFGSICSPMHFRTPAQERKDILMRLSYQALSVLGDRVHSDLSGSDLSYVVENALTYFNFSGEKYSPTMVLPTTLIPKVSSDLRDIYKKTFDLTGNVPIFGSDFDLKKLKKAIDEKGTLNTAGTDSDDYLS